MKAIKLDNAALIHEFITRPELYQRLAEDDSVPAEQWMPNLELSIWVAVYEMCEGEPDIIGMFAFVPETKIIYRFHPAIAPKHWGKKKNIDAGKLALDWLWGNTDAEKVVGKVPVIFPDLLKWGQRLGFKREGIQRKSFKKNGELVDQYYMGMSKA